MISRRDFLLAAGAAGASALTGCASPATPPLPPGDLLGGNSHLGHRLRDGTLPAPRSIEHANILIVGGGISGLAAGWKLARSGISDFQVLELETEPGGNSRAGHLNGISYPWGAHYLPLPSREARAVRELLADTGVLQGDPFADKPRYDERYLCATPQERVFRNGLWEDGLLPHLGLDSDEKMQQKRFQERMETLKQARGRDGRKVFAIPMEYSSRDPAWLALDRISFRQWLLDQGLNAPTLHWLADYACRDDFGTNAHDTSAWAGLHYFACRTGEAQDSSHDTVLTAPEGNAWLMRALATPIATQIRPGAMVYALRETEQFVEADVWFEQAQESRTLRARQLIWAAPAFTLPRVWPAMPQALAKTAAAGDYAPWLVANLHLTGLPGQGHGAPLAWDNVLYDSPALGYVVATHQLIRRHLPGTILTYYRPFASEAPRAARQRLLDTPRDVWAEEILRELSIPHPDIRQQVTRLDIFRHGHAMRRPTVGSLWSGARERLAKDNGRRITLAHADLSGFSLFEEAQYRGIVAAERVMRRLGQPFQTSI